MRTPKLLWTMVAAASMMITLAQAQVPPVINYQGQLLDASGNPASGNFTMVFSIFDVATGGTALYTETQNVAVSNGVFNVLIGSVTPIPQTLFDGSPNRLLEITVNGTVLTPRRRFASVPYAFNDGGNGATGPWQISGDNIYYNNGNVGIGTTSPNALVHSQSTGSIPSFLAGGSSADFAVPDNNQAMQFGSWNGSSVFTEWMRIGSAGHVGIGTTNPGVFSGANKYLTLSASNTFQNDKIAALELQGSSNSGAIPVARIDFGAVGVSAISHNIARIEAIPYSGGNLSQGKLVFFTHDGASLNEAMQIDHRGFVGINTTAPSDFLHVVGGVDITRNTNSTALDIQHSGLLTNALVNIETASGPPLGTNLLQVKANSAIAPDAQFIECMSGTDVKFRVNGDGDVTADGQFIGGGADFAEMMAVSSGALSVEAGDVLVIDPSQPRALVKSATPRSKLVAGIYSTKPGFVGSERDWDKRAGNATASFTPAEMAEQFNEIPLAVVGIVPCKVSAENGAIRPGDLMVTSSTPGHAMRDDDPKNGTILGKALGSLDSGTGVIKVLVTLQ